MRTRCLRTTRLTVPLIVVSVLILPAGSLRAGSATGVATEWTQLANNAQLVDLLKTSGVQVENQVTQIAQLAEQIQNQLNIYRNMLQNTARLPEHVWGEVEDDLNRLRDIVNQGQSLSFSMGNADDLLKQRFKTYADLKTGLPDAQSFATTYEKWSDTNRDTIGGTLRAASLTADQFEDEEATMHSLRSMSETADGQMKALQVGHDIAGQQVAQMQKLRGLVSQQMTMVGTWLQSEQSAKDLAQKRREEFFKAVAPSTSGGERMKVEW
jgi:type IV secretion system protein TrbJ